MSSSSSSRKASGRTKRGVRRALSGALLVGLPTLFLLLFFYYPLGQVFVEAFRSDGAGFQASPLWQTLSDAYFWDLLQFTALQALYSTLASVALGLPLAFILANYRFPLQGLVRSLTLVPFVLPSVTVALGFILFYGRQGPLNQVLDMLFGQRVQVLYSLTAIVLAHAFYNAPVVARAVYASWERLDPSCEESARSLGAGRWAVFRHVTLPLLFPGLVTGSLLAFIFSFMSFPIVLSLGGARFSTLEVEVYTQVRVLLNYPMGAALALIQTAFSLLLSYVYLLIEQRFTLEIPGVRERPRTPLFRFAPGNVAAVVYLLLLAVFYFGPVISVWLDSVGGRGGGPWNFAAYHTIFAREHSALIGDTPLEAIGNSLRFALGTVLVTLPLGTALAIGLSRRRFWGRRFLETLALAPLAVSSIAFGFGMLRTFRTGLFAGFSSETAIVLAHSVLAFPFVLRVLRPLFERLDRSLREAARSLGASGWRAFFDVELPLAAGGLLVAAIFAFSLSIAEMSAAIMLAEPGLMTMPLTVYHLLSARNFGSASAMAVVLMVITGIAFVVLERLGERLAKRTRAMQASDDSAATAASDAAGGSEKGAPPFDVFGM